MAREPEDQYALKELLEKEGYQVFGRSTHERVAQLMSVYSLDLILVDFDIPEHDAIEYCKHLRSKRYARSIPIIIIGPDDEHGNNTVAAYEAGADDFILKPFIFGVCLAKIKYHLRDRSRGQAVSSQMSVAVHASELPGVLQFLEVEEKTGKLNIKSPIGTAVLTIEEGHLINAEAPHVTGKETVIEVLCWDSLTVVFQETTLSDEDRAFETKLTSILMNASVEVDEFRELQKSLPDRAGMIGPGEKPLPKDALEIERTIHTRALEGYSLTELLQESGATERQATNALMALLQKDILKELPPPYHDYTGRCYDAYLNLSVGDKLESIRDLLSELNFPLPDVPQKTPPADGEWTTPAPTLLIAGNKLEHGQMLLDTCTEIYQAVTGQAPAARKHLGGLLHTRFVFPKRRFIDFMQLPPVLDRTTLSWLEKHREELYGVVLIASDQDRFNVSQLKRTIRLLRQRFHGVYYHVVPRIIDDGVAIFKMDCEKCGYKLAVDIDAVGDTGICPICNAEIIMPDCLDNLARVLRLPREVPVVQARLDDTRHVRDLLVFVLDTIIYSAQHPEYGTSAQERKAATEGAS